MRPWFVILKQVQDDELWGEGERGRCRNAFSFALKSCVIPAQAGTQLPFYWHQLPLLEKSLSGVGFPPTRE